MREKLHFNSLCGVVSVPENCSKIVILCHGFNSSKDSRSYIELEKRLNKLGIATFRFDFFGHGESKGDFADLTISKAVGNVLDAIEFVKSKGFDNIGLLGSSFGGMASLVAASKTNDLAFLALKSPVSDYLGVLIAEMLDMGVEDWKRVGFIERDGMKLNYSFYDDASNVSGYEAAKNIKIPTLIVHGDSDKVVPIEQSVKTASIISDCKLEIIKGADHVYTNSKDYEKMLEIVCDFIISS